MRKITAGVVTFSLVMVFSSVAVAGVLTAAQSHNASVNAPAAQNNWNSDIKDGTALALDVVTLVLAIATWRMANEAKRTSKLSLKALRGEKKRHTQNNMPLCVLIPSWSGLAYNRNIAVRLKPGQKSVKTVIGCGTSGTKEFRHHEPMTPSEYGEQYARGDYEILFPIRNIGNGPALDVKCILRFPELQADAIGDFPPIEAKGQINCDIIDYDTGIGGKQAYTKYLSVTMPLHQSGERDDVEKRKPNSADYAQSLESCKWTIYLQYNDIFKNMYHSEHPLDPTKTWGAIQSGSVPPML